MIQQVMKLQNAGYSLIEIGHTKTKLKEDVITKVQFEQLTCNLDNKYYNALKDKVNLVAMCYWENVVENIEEKKNAFTKKMDKVGELTDRKRVMVFADDDNAIDTKTHFEYITHKIDLSAEGFIKAVEEAIAIKLGTTEEKTEKKPTVKKKTTKKAEPVVEEPVEDEMDIVDDIAEDIEEDIFNEVEEETVTSVNKDVLAAIRAAYKEADADKKAEIKTILVNYGGKLANEMKPSDVKGIQKILGI